ncbi:hypothetical protein ACA910_008575 [Epithemia clementina (nom. ined.)]
MKLLAAFICQTQLFGLSDIRNIHREILVNPFVWLESRSNILSYLANKPANVARADGDLGEQGDDDDEESLDLSLEAFQRVKAKRSKETELETFDGYDFRDVLVAKWGECYDVDFNRVDSFGFRKLYLNVLPFRLGRRPWRHASELDYLCHLQAVVEILQKYDQLDYVLYQIQETDKKPLANRSPIVAVPLRLDLTTEQVNNIIGY